MQSIIKGQRYAAYKAKLAGALPAWQKEVEAAKAAKAAKEEEMAEMAEIFFMEEAHAFLAYNHFSPGALLYAAEKAAKVLNLPENFVYGEFLFLAANEKEYSEEELGFADFDEYCESIKNPDFDENSF